MTKTNANKMMSLSSYIDELINKKFIQTVLCQARAIPKELLTWARIVHEEVVLLWLRRGNHSTEYLYVHNNIFSHHVYRRSTRNNMWCLTHFHTWNCNICTSPNLCKLGMVPNTQSWWDYEPKTYFQGPLVIQHLKICCIEEDHMST